MEVPDTAMSYLPNGGGESILVMTDLVTVKLRGEAADGAFVLTEVISPPQGGPPGLHRHPDRETFYVLEGIFRFDTLQNDQPRSVEATAGAVVHFPSMVWHNYKNIGPAAGKLIAILQPGGMIDFFRDLGVPVGDGERVPRPAGPPDPQRLAAIMQKHHVEILPSPVAH